MKTTQAIPSTERALLVGVAWKRSPRVHGIPAGTPERESLVTLTFKKDGDGTLMTLQHEQFFDEDARDRHNQGWTGAMDKLAAYLA